MRVAGWKFEERWSAYVGIDDNPFKKSRSSMNVTNNKNVQMPVVDLHFVHIPGRVQRPTVFGPWYDTAVTMYMLEIRWGLVSVGVP